jgi:hypothetical protein
MDHTPICPVCGFECETIYLAGQTPVGCDCCIESQDAYEWAEDQRQANYDAYVDTLVDEAIEKRHERSNYYGDC